MKRSQTKNTSKHDGNDRKIQKLTKFFPSHQSAVVEESSAYWQCFLCGKSTRNTPEWINIHIDACLLSSESVKNSDNLNEVSSSQARELPSSSTADSLKHLSPPRPSSVSKSVGENLITIYDPSHEVFRDDIIHHHAIDGLILIHNFISVDEESRIQKFLDDDVDNPWKYSSFNGNCHSKGYGVITQFGLPAENRLVRVNDRDKGEKEIPTCILFLVDRLKRIVQRYPDIFPDCLRKFEPNEFNANQYLKTRKDYLKFHYDDRFLSGEVLMNLSMIGACHMSYMESKGGREFDVNLPRRCLQLVTGTARYRYKHGIKEENLFNEMRISMTFRQAGDNQKGVVGLRQRDNRTIDEFVNK
jgi:hypothetical protein